MHTSDKQTWAEAFRASPGPLSLKDAVPLMLKGLCMGSADIVPGVSGGTIALITGIYHKLLQAIRSIDGRAGRLLLRLDLKGALARVHLRFLLAVFSGIAAAIVSLARLMHYVLEHHPEPTWSFFFGLICASVLVLFRRVCPWSFKLLLFFLVGLLGGYALVSLIPVTTPETFGFVFLTGLLAICAMILPGVSGAFILLILGKYAYLTSLLKNPFLPANMGVILVFGAGCAVGLAVFARILNYLLNRFHNLTLAFLTGLMAGSLKKIWPWKEVLETAIVRGQVHVLRDRNVLPGDLDAGFLLACALGLAGFLLVLALDGFSRRMRA